MAENCIYTVSLIFFLHIKHNIRNLQENQNTYRNTESQVQKEEIPILEGESANLALINDDFLPIFHHCIDKYDKIY